MSSILADQWRPRICALMRAGGGLLMFLLSLLLQTRLLPMFYSTLVVSSCCCCWCTCLTLLASLLLYCCFTTYASIPALVGVNGVPSLLCWRSGCFQFHSCLCLRPDVVSVMLLLSPLLLLVAGVTTVLYCLLHCI